MVIFSVIQTFSIVDISMIPRASQKVCIERFFSISPMTIRPIAGIRRAIIKDLTMPR